MNAIRKSHHLAAVQMMNQGDYQSASEALQNAHQHFGPHVGLLSDLATCYYMNHDFISLRRTLVLIQEEVVKAEPFLSTESLAKTYIMLGKLQEEQAQVSDALENFERAIKLAVPTPLHLKARAQRLRLKSVLGLAGFEQDYEVCQRHYFPQANTQAELEHALILGEARRYGVAAAFERWKATRIHQSHVSDCNLFYYDLLEIAIESGSVNELRERGFFEETPAPQDEFEKMLLKWAQSGVRYCFEDYYTNSKSISLFSNLRLYALALQQKATGPELGPDQLRDLVSSLSESNRNLLFDTWRKALERPDGLFFSEEDSALILGDQRFLIEKDGLEYKILMILSRQNHVPVDEALAAIYQESFSESAWNKLRIALYRFNKKISPFVGKTKVFAMDKNSVRCLVALAKAASIQ